MEFQKNIDKLVSQILSEEIKMRHEEKFGKKGQWMEVDMDEELHGDQHKIDVAKPKGKITAADFKKLRKDRNEQVEIDVLGGKTKDEEKNLRKDRNEQIVIDDVLGGKTKDKEKNLRKDRNEEKDMVVIDVLGGKTKNEKKNFKNLRKDRTEQDIVIDDTLIGKTKNLRKDRNEEKDMVVIDVLGGKTKNIKKDRTEQPDVVVDDILGGKIKYEETDEEVEEGNAFTGALAKAKESGKDSFNVDGKTYQVKESQDKWIQDTGMKKGALHKALGIPEGEKIPKSKLNSIKKDLMTKAKGDKKLSTADSKLLKQVNMALTLGGLKEDKNTLSLTENELIDMIENIVKEQIVKDSAEKNNFGVTKPQGLKKTEKAQGESKKENDDYASEVVKKMKDYMKDMFMGGGSYDENPDDFPQSNYQMDKDSKIMKYDPSEAVDEYIEAFAYPGMTNLVYDEIKPDDEMIEKQIKGDSKNGNAITGKDGNALGNVSKRSEKTGDRFKKNFDDNLYGAEQMNVSYKRQTQPVDVAGEKKEGGNLSSKKTSTQKAQKIMNQLESVESKTTKIIKEDLEKMRNLISYNRKTQ
jgi:hypothetical protein